MAVDTAATRVTLTTRRVTEVTTRTNHLRDTGIEIDTDPNGPTSGFSAEETRISKKLSGFLRHPSRPRQLQQHQVVIPKQLLLLPEKDQSLFVIRDLADFRWPIRVTILAANTGVLFYKII